MVAVIAHGLARWFGATTAVSSVFPSAQRGLVCQTNAVLCCNCFVFTTTDRTIKTILAMVFVMESSLGASDFTNLVAVGSDRF